jgi:protein-S-isoprenylcysteine O-methyltransferase Ste14
MTGIQEGVPREARTEASHHPSTSETTGTGTARAVPVRQLIGIPLNVALFLYLMVLGWGSVAGFFAHPVRTGVVVLHLIMIPVMTLSTSGRSRGLKHAPDWKPFFPLLVFHSLFTAFLMPYMDARDILVLPGGDALRWTGFVVLATGVALRLGPMLELGRRFVSVVAVQEGHTLHTKGFYALVRHPSYLGIVLMDLGFAGVFRSVVALLLMPMVFWMFKRRMDVEEAFMQEQFGTAYRDYMARTSRLLPGVY